MYNGEIADIGQTASRRDCILCMFCKLERCNNALPESVTHQECGQSTRAGLLTPFVFFHMDHDDSQSVKSSKNGSLTMEVTNDGRLVDYN